MSKKEFYDTYIKDDRTEDEKMMDIIHENARKKKDNKTIKKSRYVLETAVYVSQVICWIGLGIIIGALWIK